MNEKLSSDIGSFSRELGQHNQKSNSKYVIYHHRIGICHLKVGMCDHRDGASNTISVKVLIKL